MRWLRARWATVLGHRPARPPAVDEGDGRLPYHELISEAQGDDQALDARLRQSAERIQRHDEAED